METLHEQQMDGGRLARVLMTDRADGDLSSNLEESLVEERRRSIVDLPWSWLRQVHGSDVVVVTTPGEHAGAIADAAVSNTTGVVLAVQVADCVPVALLSAEVVAVAHAGWKGLAEGVLEKTVQQARELGAGTLRAVVGPCVGPECYEFGEPELTQLSEHFGPEVRSTTAAGKPAMDMAAGVRAALLAEGVSDVTWANPCTSCCPDRYWSYRARAQAERQAMIVEVVSL